MKPGRNDPCSCGSGKKYKKCCLHTPPSAQELSWQRQHRINENLPAKLMGFAAEKYGKFALYEAWEEFNLGGDIEFDIDAPVNQLFMPWFLYHWRPDPSDTSVFQTYHGRSISQAFLAQEKHLDRHERQYVEAVLGSGFSFHDVVQCEPGHGFLLRDVFTGEEKQVLERSASRPARKGDIIFGIVVEFEGIYILDGCGPLLIPPRYKKPLVDLRKQIRRRGVPLTAGLLRDHDLEMFDVYHGIAKQLQNPPMPKLQNTDGDPLCFYKLRYEIKSPQAVFDALQSLRLFEDDADPLDEARYDKDGKLEYVEFSWHKKGNKMHKHWDNTVMGHLFIDGNKMTIEVNSKRRADKIKRLIKKLAPEAVHRTVVIEDVEKKLAKARTQGPPKSDRLSGNQGGDPVTGGDPLNSPEAQAAIEQMMKAHWDAWLRKKIPVLGNRSPLQAIKDHDGRELVEALLCDFERHPMGADDSSAPPIEWLRLKLGLLEKA